MVRRMASPEFTAMYQAMIDNPPPFPDDVADARRVMESFMGGAPLVDGTTVEATDAGGRPALWVRPPSGGDRQRALLYLHGGGYRLGSANCYKAFASHLAAGLDAPVLVLDYRLAPEDPFPAAVDDAVAAHRWLVDVDGLDAGGLAIAGDSAGGGLTAATLVAIRDAGLPQPGAAVCLSPWADLSATADSYYRCAATDPFFSRDRALASAASYVPDVAHRADPLASPVFADFTGVAPVLIHASGCEVLADDATALGKAMRRNGVDVTVELWPGLTHVWHTMTPDIPESRDAVEEVVAFIRNNTARSAQAAVGSA
jgi:monoterpene epsilon-lactone hydrolase